MSRKKAGEGSRTFKWEYFRKKEHYILRVEGREEQKEQRRGGGRQTKLERFVGARSEP